MRELTLRPFIESDFSTLTAWVPTPDALAQWCAGFFRFPLDNDQLHRYLNSAAQPHTREIFTADLDGEAIGHVELSMIWPHLSCRLSRVLVAPHRRYHRFGENIVDLACARAFGEHHVSRIDLGVSDENAAAIACYARVGFTHVGTWRDAILANRLNIHVCWMTLTRAAWMVRPKFSN